MRAPPQVRLEEFQKLMKRVLYESERGALIIVEGHRDRDSLREMGITGRIFCLQNSGRNTVTVAEDLGRERCVIVLTDFDREGVFLAKRFARTLISEKVRTNLFLWRDLRRLVKSDIRSIEELPKFYRRLQAENRDSFAQFGQLYETPILTRHKRIVKRSLASKRATR